MKFHFANSAFVKAPKRAVQGFGSILRFNLPVRFGILDHPKFGPVLIDTGYTNEIYDLPNKSWYLKIYSALLGPNLIEKGQPKAVLGRLFYTNDDVNYVIVTHFHPDHISGLRQFKNATFLIDMAAFEKIKAQSPATNAKHGVFLDFLPDDFESRCVDIWDAFKNQTHVFHDQALEPVSLPGHADGHFGVMIRTEEKPFLYAVDTQWSKEAVKRGIVPRLLGRMVASDFEAYEQTSQAVAEMMEQGMEVFLCHDTEPTRFDLDLD